MPSKKKNRGNPVVVLRLSPELLARIDAAVAKSQNARFEGGYDRSSFIRACIEERFDKYARARKASAKRKTPTPAEVSQAFETLPGPDQPSARLDALDAIIERVMGE